MAHFLEKVGALLHIPDSDISPLAAKARRLALLQGRPQDLRQLNTVLQELGLFCRTNREGLHSLLQEQGLSFRQDYQSRVGTTSVLLISGESGESQSAKIASTLREACYYDVERFSLEDCFEVPSESHIIALYAGRSADVEQGRKRCRPHIILSDVGGREKGFRMGLSRLFSRLDRNEVTLLYRPFPAIRLLDCFEKVNIQILAEREGGLQKAEDAD